MRQHFAKNTKTIRNASFAFAATFLIVVFSGIFVIGIVALLDDSTNDTESILSVWDVIPEAGQTKNAAISGDNNAGKAADAYTVAYYTYSSYIRHAHHQDSGYGLSDTKPAHYFLPVATVRGR